MNADALPTPPAERPPIGRVLRYTPLSDLLRGRWTARLDIDGALRAVGLPAAAIALIRRVVTLTRLRRIEKADVAAELANHFAEGLAAGQSIERLIVDFGDPKEAAKLIRRAKKRNRGIIYKSFARTAQALLVSVLLLIAVYGLLWVRLLTKEVRITQNFAAEHNAPILAAPETDKAWPAYRAAYLKIATRPTVAAERAERPPDAGWADLEHFVTAEAERIAEFRAAADRPMLGALWTNAIDTELQSKSEWFAGKEPNESTASQPATDNPPVISILLPEISVLRFASRSLAMDARLARAKGDATRLGDDLEAIWRIATHTSENRMLLGTLVQMAILELGMHTLRDTLRESPALLDDDRLARSSHQIMAVSGGREFQLNFSEERIGIEDLLQRAYSDDGNGDGDFCGGGYASTFYTSVGYSIPSGRGVATPVLSVICAGRRRVLREFDDYANQFTMPLWKRTRSDSREVSEPWSGGFLAQLRYLPVAWMTPSFERANLLTEHATQRRDATLVIIACELFKRRHGHYPDALGELTPALLPSVPPDRFDGKPIKYRRDGDGYVLYSVGADRDDDGGHWPENPDARLPGRYATQRNLVNEWCAPGDVATALAEGTIADGDWLFWPIVDESRPAATQAAP